MPTLVRYRQNEHQQFRNGSTYEVRGFGLSLGPKMRIRNSLILLTGLIVVNTSCLDEPECFGLNNNIVGITFKNLEDGKVREMTFISIVAEGTETGLRSAITASTVTLPLNYFVDKTSYTFHTSDTSYNLKLNYSSRTQFVSTSCGVKFILSDLEVAEHTFDSVRLVHAKPGNSANARNIELFLE